MMTKLSCSERANLTARVIIPEPAAPILSHSEAALVLDDHRPMVSFFIFSAPLLVIRGSPPGIRSGRRKRRGRSNSSSTRQTVSELPIRPSPLTRGQPPSPSGPSRLLGAKSHKTSVLRTEPHLRYPDFERTRIALVASCKGRRSCGIR
jgi:hypothetical protein